MSRHIRAGIALANALALCAAFYLLPGCSPIPPRETPPAIIDSIPEGLVADEKSPATIRVAGLGPNNTITGAELRFRVEGIKDLDADSSIGMAINDATKTFVPLARHWRLDDQTGALVISDEDVRGIMKKLPVGPVTIIIGLAGQGGELPINAQFKANKWSAKVASASSR